MNSGACRPPHCGSQCFLPCCSALAYPVAALPCFCLAGEYESHMSKDSVCKDAAAIKIGTGDRTGRTNHIKTLSVSRSIQHGIDWHVPVIVQLKVAPQAASTVDALGQAGDAVMDPALPCSVDPGSLGLPLDYTPPTNAAQQELQQQQQLDGQSGERSSYMLPPPRKDRGAYLGAPPAPPPQVARAIRQGMQAQPGDWDWSKLGKNYRNNFTTLHGGAYAHGAGGGGRGGTGHTV